MDEGIQYLHDVDVHVDAEIGNMDIQRFNNGQRYK